MWSRLRIRKRLIGLDCSMISADSTISMISDAARTSALHSPDLKNGMNLSHFDIIGTVDLDKWYQQPIYHRATWLYKQLKSLHRSSYSDNERILLRLYQGDEYQDIDSKIGKIMSAVVKCLWHPQVCMIMCLSRYY